MDGCRAPSGVRTWLFLSLLGIAHALGSFEAQRSREVDAACSAGPAAAGLCAFDHTHLQPPGWHRLLSLQTVTASPLAAHGLQDRMRVVVGLRQRYDVVDEVIANVSTPEHPDFLRRFEFDEVHALAAHPGALENVLQWLASENVPRQHIRVSSTKSFLTVSLPPSQVERIFRTELHFFSLHPKVAMSSVLKAQRYHLPRAVAYSVDLVDLTMLPAIRPRKTTAAAQDPTAPHSRRLLDATDKILNTLIEPNFLKSYYEINVNYQSVGSSAVQGVFESAGEGYSKTDLLTFNNVSNTKSNVVDVGQIPSCSAGHYCLEGDLDIQYTSSMADGAPTAFWYVPWGNGNAFLTWALQVAEAKQPPAVFSISYALREDMAPVASLLWMNLEIGKLGLRGVTVISAAGDWGPESQPDCTQCHGYHPEFPASSPYVIAVGGSALSPSGVEIACTKNMGCVYNSGSGLSSVFNAPFYQAKHIQQYIETHADVMPPTSLYNSVGRAYPDVTLLAFSFRVVTGGQTVTSAGTSLAAPLLASLVTLINNQLELEGKKPVGILTPLLYRAAELIPETFTDIVNGTNGECCGPGYVATPGFDLLTGLGGVKFPKLLSAVKTLYGYGNNVVIPFQYCNASTSPIILNSMHTAQWPVVAGETSISFLLNADVTPAANTTDLQITVNVYTSGVTPTPPVAMHTFAARDIGMVFPSTPGTALVSGTLPIVIARGSHVLHAVATANGVQQFCMDAAFKVDDPCSYASSLCNCLLTAGCGFCSSSQQCSTTYQWENETWLSYCSPSNTLLKTPKSCASQGTDAGGIPVHPSFTSVDFTPCDKVNFGEDIISLTYVGVYPYPFSTSVNISTRLKGFLSKPVSDLRYSRQAHNKEGRMLFATQIQPVPALVGVTLTPGCFDLTVMLEAMPGQVDDDSVITFFIYSGDVVASCVSFTVNSNITTTGGPCFYLPFNLPPVTQNVVTLHSASVCNTIALASPTLVLMHISLIPGERPVAPIVALNMTWALQYCCAGCTGCSVHESTLVQYVHSGSSSLSFFTPALNRTGRWMGHLTFFDAVGIILVADVEVDVRNPNPITPVTNAVDDSDNYAGPPIVYVSGSGQDVAQCGISAEQACASLEFALQHAVVAGQVVLLADTFNHRYPCPMDTIQIDSQINIRASGGHITIDCSASNATLFAVNALAFVLTDFTIYGGTSTIIEVKSGTDERFLDLWLVRVQFIRSAYSDSACVVVNVTGGQVAMTVEESTFKGAYRPGYSQSATYVSLLLGNVLATQLLFSNVTLSGASQGAMEIVQDHGGDAAYIFENCVFADNRDSYGQGAGLIVILRHRCGFTNMSFVRTDFVNNSGLVGGALGVQNLGYAHDVNIEVGDCKFAHNHARWTGGGAIGWQGDTADGLSLSLSHSTFVNNSGSEVGGAVALMGGSVSSLLVSVFHCTFEHNRAMFGLLSSSARVQVAGGGAMMAYFVFGFTRSVVRLIESTFTNNSVSEDRGGAFTLELGKSAEAVTDSVIAVFRCSFINNAAENGGALSISVSSKYAQAVAVEIVESSFLSNTATGSNGGAVILNLPPDIPSVDQSNPSVVVWSKGAQVLMTNTTFRRNSCAGHDCNGGGLVLTNGRLVAMYSEFTDNLAASGRGGGVATQGTGSMSLSHCTFAGNEALFGSALHSTAEGVVNMSSCVFEFTGLQGSDNSTEGLSFLQSSNMQEANTMFRCPAGSIMQTFHNNNVQALRYVRWLVPSNASQAVLPHAVGPTKYRWGLIRSQTSRVVCTACAPLFYSVSPVELQGLPTNLDVTYGRCLQCPTGADCSLGGSKLRILPDFWPVQVPGADASTPETRVVCSLCPTGYCPQSKHSMEELPCLNGRGGRLCGGCLPGYSQSLMSTSCVRTDHCTDGPLFFSATAIVGLVYLCYFLFSSIHSSGMVKLTVFFVQGAGLLIVSQSQLQVLVRFFHLQVPTGPSDSFCPVPHLSTTLSLAYGFAPSIGLSALLLILYAFFRCGLCKCHYRLVVAYDRLTYCSCELYRLGAQAPIASTATFVAAATKLMLFTYGAMIQTTFSLLQCVSISGLPGRSFLFQAADVECYQPWQNALFVLLIVLVLLPLGLLVLGLRSQRSPRRPLQDVRSRSSSTSVAIVSRVKPSQHKHSALGNGLSAREFSDKRLHSPDGRSTSVQFPLSGHSDDASVPSVHIKASPAELQPREVITTLLSSPYRPECSYWESVLILQLLLLALLGDFVTDRVTQQICQTAVCIVFLLAHALMRPMRSTVVNMFQTTCLLCWALLAVINIPIAFSSSVGLAESVTTLSSPTMEALLLLIPLVWVCIDRGVRLSSFYRTLRAEARRGGAGRAFAVLLKNGTTPDTQEMAVQQIPKATRGAALSTPLLGLVEESESTSAASVSME